MSEDAKPGRTH